MESKVRCFSNEDRRERVMEVEELEMAKAVDRRRKECAA